MSFSLFLVGFVEKGPKTANFRQCRGSYAVPTPRLRVPMPLRGREGRMDQPRLRRYEA